MNGGLVALLAIVCLVIGLFGGAAAGVVTANENYVIPDTVQVTTSTAGAFDVTEIKSADMSAHFLELGNNGRLRLHKSRRNRNSRRCRQQSRQRGRYI